MFLSIQEMKKNKLRYGLVALVIVMIAYLIFILTALAFGLSNASKQAVDTWHADKIVLNADANGSLDQSNIEGSQAHAYTNKSRADIVQMAGNVQTTKQQNKVTAQIMGLQKGQFIYKDLHIQKGHTFKNDRQVVVDQSLLQNNGYHLGQWIKFSRTGKTYQIVGTIKNTTLNVAPVVYGTDSAIREAKFGDKNSRNVSALVYKKAPHQKVSGTEVFNINDFIQNIPGYSAQNSTFSFMIVFLLLITLVIIAIFLFVLTMQKIPYFAVMKIQGISNGYLAFNIISTAVILTVAGIVVSGILTALTAMAMPAAVPMTFDIRLMSLVVALLILMSVIGAIIPMRTVSKIDPAIAMGGK